MYRAITDINRTLTWRNRRGWGRYCPRQINWSLTARDDHMETRGYWKLKGGTRSHCVENWPWWRLYICSKTDYGMKERMNEWTNERASLTYCRYSRSLKAGQRTTHNKNVGLPSVAEFVWLLTGLLGGGRRVVGCTLSRNVPSCTCVTL